MLRKIEQDNVDNKLTTYLCSLNKENLDVILKQLFYNGKLDIIKYIFTNPVFKDKSPLDNIEEYFAIAIKKDKYEEVINYIIMENYIIESKELIEYIREEYPLKLNNIEKIFSLKKLNDNLNLTLKIKSMNKNIKI